MSLKSRIGLFSLAALVFNITTLAQTGWVTGRAGTAQDLVAVYFTSAETGWVAGDGGYLASTADGGRTWTPYPLGTSEDINEIYFRNDENGYLVAGTKMFITKDGGRSWKETRIYRPEDFPRATPELLSIRFADKKRGLAIGSLLNSKEEVIDSLVLKTDDGGESWRRVSVPSRKELFHLDFNGSDRAWIVGDEGLILASTDSGATWQVQQSGTRLPLYNVDFRDDNEGYIVGKTGTILRTDNGGKNWLKVNAGYRETFMRVDFADDKNGWIVGYGGAILRSSDRGQTWVRQDSKTTANLYGLFMTKKYGWAVGAKGETLKYIR